MSKIFFFLFFFCQRGVDGAVKGVHSDQVAHRARAYPDFCSMKQLRVFLLPPGWDASASQGYPQH